LAISKWRVLEATKKPINVGQIIEFDRQSRATILKRDATGTTAKVESPIPVTQLLRESGQMPLPPYIKRQPSREDHGWYQTCFAKHEGAIAAPTAGLHFTADLLSRLAERSIQVATITLHVGPGTFKPVVTERIEDHQMGAETFEVGPEAAEAIARTKQTGRRVVAVGYASNAVGTINPIGRIAERKGPEPFAALKEVFETSREEGTRRSALNGIAEWGGGPAADFLVSIAMNASDAETAEAGVSALGGCQCMSSMS
jgi:S-adenosylmethionine:tRNA ribosyltransferase-isomerase